jgi:hypothetical protein
MPCPNAVLGTIAPLLHFRFFFAYKKFSTRKPRLSSSVLCRSRLLAVT